MKRKELSIYIHIPFCKRKCNYCDFCSFTDGTEELHSRYVGRICEEIRSASVSAQGYAVKTVYFGGGTPSLLDASLFERVLSTLRESFCVDEAAEITLECNPATAREGFFEKLRSIGVNRLSIGLQSADDTELAALGRLHGYADFEHTGRLGCAQCYRDFSAQLKPSLQKIHGRTQHAGRKPKAFVPDPQDELNQQLNELRRQMDEAVAAENFEEAARLRDEIRALTETQEVTQG